MHRILIALVGVLMLSAAGYSAEIVQYQCPEWKAKHIHESKKAEKIAETLTKIGCEVKKDEHDGHIDVKYRCEQWKQLELKSHEEAHKWEKWLKEFGFKTQHKH
jgi:hypothetical protein